MSAPVTYPRLLSLADYARACTEATGKPVSRQSIHQRVQRGSLTTEEQTVGGATRAYINTETHPPGPAPGRWPNRPAGSVSLPRRPRTPAAS